MRVRDSWQRAFGIDCPQKIVCVGLNYSDHSVETGLALPDEPLLFGKFANSVVDGGEPIVLPAQASHVDAEAELAVVIGTPAKQVGIDDALEFVHGYTAANDVSARDLQFKDGQWFRGKAFDTFCPLLGDIVPTAQLGAADDLQVIQRLNGEVLQAASTRLFIFDVRTLVSFISGVVTLMPGDIVLTGTPAGSGFFREPKVALAPGDVVEVEIGGVGTLTNPVIGPSLAG